MPKIKYVSWKPNATSKRLIEQANQILVDFTGRGFSLSVRQLYYQLVSQNIIPNKVKYYNMMSNLVRKAREAGMIDWNHIQDRGRFVREHQKWHDGADALRDLTQKFRLDLWAGQPFRVEVWVEKDALIEVVGRATSEYDVPHVSCKGYASASVIWEAAHSRFLRFHGNASKGPEAKRKQPKFLILHLSDHDPSGINMTQDLTKRMEVFSNPYHDLPRPQIFVKRIGLTLDQVEKFKLPPNPAKESDPRFKDYEQIYGDESWELDALDPSQIVKIIKREIAEVLDTGIFEQRVDEQESIRERFRQLAMKAKY